MKLPAKIVILIAALMAGTLQLCAQTASEQESRKARLQREIREIESQLKDNSTRSANALSQLSLTRQKIQARKELLEESERELKALDDSVAAGREEVAAVQSRLDTMVFYYGKLVRNAYKNRDAKIWYMHLLASESVAQAGRRYSYLRNLSGQMNTQARKIKDTKAELEAKLGELKILQDKARLARDEQSRALGTLKAEEGAQKSIIARLGKEKNVYQKQLATRRKQVEALDREIKKLIAEAVKGSSKSSKSGSGTGGKTVTQKPEDFKLTGEFEANKGRLPWPAAGRIADRFGQHNHPVYKSVKLPFNNGVSITVAKGTEAKVVFDGEVKRVIVMPGYNKCVLVQHGGYFTFYCKLSSVSVKAGDKLKAGQTVGIVDTIDGQTQLHFQVWKGTDPLDPELWLKPRG